MFQFRGVWECGCAAQPANPHPEPSDGEHKTQLHCLLPVPTVDFQRPAKSHVHAGS